MCISKSTGSGKNILEVASLQVSAFRDLEMQKPAMMQPPIDPGIAAPLLS
jgi:hypothetical protein